jgi:hypothetical protein
MYNSYVILTYIVIVISLVFIIHNRNRNSERFSSELDHPSKCFSCASSPQSAWRGGKTKCFSCASSPQSAWRGGKTKCFSCLKQAYDLSGGNECAVFNEQPIRYYELPPIPGMGYAKMGHI